LFWVICILLLVLAFAFIAVPVLRQRVISLNDRQQRAAANLAIYQERLEELHTDLRENLIDQAQFTALKAELSRSLLTDVEDQDLRVDPAVAEPDKKALFSAARLMPLLASVFLLAASFVLYDLWGAQNDLKLAGIVERTAEARDNPQAIADLIYEIGDVVEDDRENAWAWYLMARNLVMLGQMPEAASAFDRAAQLMENPQDKAAVLGQYAQAQYVASGQELTEEVMGIITQAQRLNPREMTVLQLLGADAYVNQDYQSALTYWQQVLTMMPTGPDSQFIQQMMADAESRLESQGGAGSDAVAPQVAVNLSVSQDITVSARTRVFVSAQQADGTAGPPLAVKVLQFSDLPTVVTLSDADAVGPFALSSAESVSIVATISLSGSADVARGDYQGRSGIIRLPDDSEEPVSVSLQISDVVRE
tara:strand:+ start:1798 stop:3060 length:1263 start_codon:yes stop_codon:yes gene_type:complete